MTDPTTDPTVPTEAEETQEAAAPAAAARRPEHHSLFSRLQTTNVFWSGVTAMP